MTKRNNSSSNPLTAAQLALVEEFIYGACCEFEIDDKRTCGRKHGQNEGGNIISLFEVRDGLTVKGIVCSVHRSMIKSRRSFNPIRAVATQSVLNLDPELAKPGPTNNTGGEGERKKRHQRRNRKPSHKRGPMKLNLSPERERQLVTYVDTLFSQTPTA